MRRIYLHEARLPTPPRPRVAATLLQCFREMGGSRPPLKAMVQQATEPRPRKVQRAITSSTSSVSNCQASAVLSVIICVDAWSRCAFSTAPLFIFIVYTVYIYFLMLYFGSIAILLFICICSRNLWMV